MWRIIPVFIGCLLAAHGCSKGGSDHSLPPAPPPSFSLNALTVNGVFNGFKYQGVNTSPVIRLSFTEKIDAGTVNNAFSFASKSGTAVPFTVSMDNGDSTVILRPSAPLRYLTSYDVAVNGNLRSVKKGELSSALSLQMLTQIDSTDKFARITDEALLTLVQQQTFKYFWDGAHPVSGLARDRNTSGETVSSGGSGFGIMAIVVAVQRGFITRAAGLAQLQKIVAFLKTKAETFHGAFPHWLNGTTGKAIAFGQKDDGADLVETAYLVQGLLTARQYFNDAALSSDINSIADAVEWSWFRKNNENVLYWHWSPDYNWDMNMPIRGWNECLITYVLAASSKNYSIPRIVYDEGWANNGSIRNGNQYYNLQLPLGPALGGPLFFSHYSFLGINPNGLKDQYADYQQQVVNHTKINAAYCSANPAGHYGYSADCWGLTASDIPDGYTASSPTNDVGVIAPTAALSSFPYTPDASMRALKFYYYKLGDKLWKAYGFTDAFSLEQSWFADSFLAIDQGPVIIMIENYRSGLLWNLFMSCPEVKTGMRSLGFQGPGL
ncbi:glucoamylase family protein [Chitinophaga vietnamensis]|uniref:glucoamylase family protein n=1 Tax=Chitinophaga vietnamensis TaxID=2593957 RepID=UPI0011788BC0|nr:glucoamylase family protein [Chitinophaga vietnamensis]